MSTTVPSLGLHLALAGGASTLEPADQLASIEFWGRVIATLFLFAFGACVGSFLNVLVYRLPAGQSVVTPPSRCPMCGHRLGWHENLPILAWIWLRGRCSACKAPISVQYPLIELAIGLLFAGFYLLYFAVPADSWLAPIGGPWWRGQGFLYAWPMFLAILVLLTGLVAMTVIDARTFTIPPELSMAVILVGFAAAIVQPFLVHYRVASIWPVDLPQWKGSCAALGGLAGALVANGLLWGGRIAPSFTDYDEHVKEGDPLSSYPFARREMSKEVAFLAPIVIGIAVGWLVGSLPSFGGATPPLLVRSVAASGLGFLVGGGLIWFLRVSGTYVFNREAMGLGDVHLLAGVGAVLGWQDAVWTLALAPFLAFGWLFLRVPLGAILKVRWREIPLGPYLALAAFVRVLARPWIDGAWHTWIA